MTAHREFRLIDILQSRQFRLAQGSFGPAKWLPVPYLPDHVLAEIGWKLAGPGRDASALSVPETAKLFFLLKKPGLHGEDLDAMQALLKRTDFFGNLPTLDVDVNEDSPQYDPSTSRDIAWGYAKKIDAFCKELGLGTPSWHTTNARGGLHGDLIAPPGIKSVHLLRGILRVVQKGARAHGIPTLSSLPQHKKDRPAVYLDDTLFTRTAEKRGVQWRLVGSKKPGGLTKQPVVLETLQPLAFAPLPIPGDPQVFLEAIAHEAEVVRRTEERIKQKKIVASELALPVSGSLLVGDAELIEATPRLRKLWYMPAADVDDRSKHLEKMLRTAMQAGADRTCLSRLAWNMPGANKVLQDHRDQRYVDQTIDSAERNMLRGVVEQEMLPPVPLPTTREVVLEWIASASDTGRKWLVERALSSTLLLSRLNVGTATMIAALGGGDSAKAAVAHVTQQEKPPGAVELRDVMGVEEIRRMAYVLAQDLNVGFDKAWAAISPDGRNTEKRLEPLIRALTKIADDANLAGDRKLRERANKVRRRLISSTECGERVTKKNHDVCSKTLMKKVNRCSDVSCNVCLKQLIRDVLELLKLPEKVHVYYRSGFSTREAAAKAFRGLLQYGFLRPRELLTLEHDGWAITMLVDAKHHDTQLMARTMPALECHENLTREQALVWVVRALSARYVTSHQAMETGDAASARRLVQAHGKHLTSTRSEASIGWPSREEMRELRIQRFQEAQAKKAAANPDAVDPELCPCLESTVKEADCSWSCHKTNGEVIVKDLLSPPTLAQLIAYERKEPIRLNRKRARVRFVSSFKKRE